MQIGGTTYVTELQTVSVTSISTYTQVQSSGEGHVETTAVTETVTASDRGQEGSRPAETTSSGGQVQTVTANAQSTAPPAATSPTTGSQGSDTARVTWKSFGWLTLSLVIAAYT